MRSWVVVPQPDSPQIAERKVRGQQKHVNPTSLKDWLLGVCEVVGLTFSFRPLQSYGHLYRYTYLSALHRPSNICVSPQAFIEVTDLRRSGGTMSMACAEIQQITILSQGIIILKHCYLDLVCGKTWWSSFHLKLIHFKRVTVIQLSTTRWR